MLVEILRSFGATYPGWIEKAVSDSFETCRVLQVVLAMALR